MRLPLLLALVAAVAGQNALRPRGTTPARVRALAALPAQRTAMATFFVAVNGSDATGDGSRARPWATWDFARIQVQSVVAHGMTGDVFVYFEAGVYALAKTVEFTPLDSATSAPFIIHYAADPANGPAPVVFSGATQVPGPWTPVGGVSPAFTTSYAGAPSRQLFVNGLRAASPTFNASFMKATGNITEEGYHIMNDSSLLEWWAAQPKAPSTGAADPFECVYTGIGSSWTEARCRIASLASDGQGGVDVVMQQPCWANGRARGGSSNKYQEISFPASLENVAAALTEPGTGMLSLATQAVFYVPREGEDMATATAAVPVLEALITLTGQARTGGAPPTPVSGISFEGLIFEHATWLLPSTGEGYIDNQAGQIYLGVPGVNSSMMLTPAAVAVHTGSSVSFVGCTFRHIGEAALLVDAESVGCVVANCTFWDVSGGAIFLGDVDDANAPANEQDGEHVVFNNYISELPVEYHGCGALVTGYVTNTQISHNEIWNASDGSIESGWGWGGGDFDTNVSITYNKIVNSNWLLVDCGSIYVNGVNGGSEIAHNYCVNQTQLFGALYPDEGSSLWNIHDNVVENAVEWLHIWTGSINRITVVDNFYGPLTFNTSKGTNCTVVNNTWVPPGTSWPQAALDIMGAAGNVDGTHAPLSG